MAPRYSMISEVFPSPLPPLPSRFGQAVETFTSTPAAPAVPASPGPHVDMVMISHILQCETCRKQVEKILKIEVFEHHILKIVVYTLFAIMAYMLVAN